jgi:hypothetical protein
MMKAGPCAWRLSPTTAPQFHLDADPHSREKWYVGHAAELSAAGV